MIAFRKFHSFNSRTTSFAFLTLVLCGAPFLVYAAATIPAGCSTPGDCDDLTPSFKNITVTGEGTSPDLTVRGAISGALIMQNGAGDNYFMGNVGIGTTSPTAYVEIVAPAGETISSAYRNLRMTGNGGANNPGFTIQDSSSDEIYSIIAGADAFKMQARDSAGSNPLNAITIHGTGGVSIGHSAWNTNPGNNNLIVGGTVGVGKKVQLGTLEILQAYDTNSGGLAISSNDNAASLRFWIDSSDVRHIDAGGNGTALIQFNSGGGDVVFGGDVGIGTTNPVIKLTVNDDSPNVYGAAREIMQLVDTTNFAAGVGGGLSFMGKGNAAGGLIQFASLKGIKENGTDGNYLGAFVLATSLANGVPTERLRVDSSGNVGIGITVPKSKLHVSGVIQSTPTDAPGTCSADTEGGMYYDASLNEPCFCNASNWVQFDGGGTCS